MYEICVIGDKDSVLGFKALGFTVYIVHDAAEAEQIIEKAARNYAVIFIADNYARELKSVIDEYRNRKLPSIVPIYGGSGETGVGMKIIRDAMERAVGADILFKSK
jgi:V/A-type H+/Na+-transporting ATPase subunit F